MGLQNPRQRNRFCDWAKIWATEELPLCFRHGKEIFLLFPKASRAAMRPALPSVEWAPETFSFIARESKLLWQMATTVIVCSSRGRAWKNGNKCCTFLSWHVSPSGPKLPDCWGLEITLRHTTVGRTPLDGDRPVTDTSTWQHLQQTDIHAAGGIRTHNTSKRTAADPFLRWRDHRGRQVA